jgi:hypothetical protein
MFNASIINLETGVQLIGRSVNYTTLNDGIEVMESLARELTNVSGGPDDTLDDIRNRAAAFGGAAKPAAQGSGRGGALGYGALNLALGLGSFIQKDWVGGVTLLAGYGAAAGLIVWELSFEYNDDLAGIPGVVGLGVAGVTALYGFIRPMLYQRSRRLAGIVDGVNLALVRGNQDRGAVRLSYTLKF